MWRVVGRENYSELNCFCCRLLLSVNRFSFLNFPSRFFSPPLHIFPLNERSNPSCVLKLFARAIQLRFKDGNHTSMIAIFTIFPSISKVNNRSDVQFSCISFFFCVTATLQLHSFAVLCSRIVSQRKYFPPLKDIFSQLHALESESDATY